jgi:hypothetical protein
MKCKVKDCPDDAAYRELCWSHWGETLSRNGKTEDGTEIGPEPAMTPPAAPSAHKTALDDSIDCAGYWEPQNMESVTAARTELAALREAKREMVSALTAISGMTTNPTTNHAQLSALCIAVARAALAKWGGE